MHVADGHAQPDFFGLEPRRPLVGLERLLLAHQPRRHGGDGDPALRVLRLDLHQVACGCVRLLEPPERQQRRPEPAPRERQVCGLFQGMTQQPLGIAGLVGRERERREPAQRRRRDSDRPAGCPERCLRAFLRSSATSAAVACLDALPLRIRRAARARRRRARLHTARGRRVHRRRRARRDDGAASSPAPAAPPRAPARHDRRAGRRAPGPRARAAKSGTRASSALERARCSRRVLSCSSSATPSSHRQFTSPGTCASSARSQRSAVAARPARRAACAWRRLSSNAAWRRSRSRCACTGRGSDAAQFAPACRRASGYTARRTRRTGARAPPNENRPSGEAIVHVIRLLPVLIAIARPAHSRSRPGPAAP